MNIGILTFHYCNNYGAVLQAFALQQYLKQLGHSPYFVNYKLKVLTQRYKLFSPIKYRNKSLTAKVVTFLKNCYSLPQLIRKKKRYEAFRQLYFKEIRVEQLNDLDGIVVGSDQVWNRKITKGYDPVYWGSLYRQCSVCHYSYAASAPATEIGDEVGEYLKNFKLIGIREIKLQNRLNELFHVDTALNCDPVFLLPSEQWIKTAGDSQMILGRYTLSYNLNGVKGLRDFEERKFGGSSSLISYTKDKRFRSAGPKEFLNYFRFSTKTLVSSFHGVAFSILFHKPFLYFPVGNEKDERVLPLLSSLGLECCIYCEGSEVNQNIDWGKVDERLQELIEQSKSYINRVLSDCKKIKDERNN